MRILLTNDDGIRAPGIEALYHALADPARPFADEIHPIAPLTVQSATSHGVTFSEPLMVSDVSVFGVEGIAVDGRPADCVKLGICTLWPERFGERSIPDLVISGMNAGANVGINVVYSGTVAAALEAAFLGVPSIAVSLHIGKGRTDWAKAGRLARYAIDRVVRAGVGEKGLLFPHSCVNINIPVCDDHAEPRTTDEPEILVCPMNTHGLVDAYERRESPSGDVYYWASGGGLDFRAADEGTDVAHLLERKIVLTPLQYDLTRPSELDGWRDALS